MFFNFFVDTYSNFPRMAFQKEVQQYADMYFMGAVTGAFSAKEGEERFFIALSYFCLNFRIKYRLISFTFLNPPFFNHCVGTVILKLYLPFL